MNINLVGNAEYTASKRIAKIWRRFKMHTTAYMERRDMILTEVFDLKIGLLEALDIYERLATISNLLTRIALRCNASLMTERQTKWNETREGFHFTLFLSRQSRSHVSIVVFPYRPMRKPCGSISVASTIHLVIQYTKQDLVARVHKLYLLSCVPHGS